MSARSEPPRVEPEPEPNRQHRSSYYRRDASDALVYDGFAIPDLAVPEDAPPAYGDVLNELHLSQSGFEAGAAVTNDGRVNINIREKHRRLANLLAPTLRNQLVDSSSSGHEPIQPAFIPPSLGGQPGQTPPPKMNIVVQIVGSRGDVQPFVALGKVLHEAYGHRVRIATHGTFQKFVEENGLEFFNVGGDPAELMAFMVKNPGLMPGLDALKAGEVQKRRKGMEEILVGCWRSCIETGNGLGPPPPAHRRKETGADLPVYGNEWEKPFVADAIIANPPSFAHIHVAEKLGIPLHMMFTMPWSPTRAFPHPLANIQSSNTDVTMTNYTSYALVEMMTWQGLGDVINRFRIKALDLEPLSLMWAPGLLTRLRIPYTYCWSPALIPKPPDWGNNISISGFYFLNLASSYTPDPELAAYLASGPPPVYIGFGSIVVDDPNAMTRLIFDAVSMAGVRALVSQGWGGLGADSVGIPEGIFMLGNCPHDWLFKHVSAVVHHGGAGTTAAGINAGKPTVVVPFFGDQPFWGSMIQRAGAGPAPIPHKSLTADNLAEALRECMKPETQARAEELGQKIRQEQGCNVGGMKFHAHLNMDKLRCSFAPSRIAVWRVRRTKIRLSAFAASVLLNERLIQLSDLKFYRSKEYDTEEQPWDPISAVAASLLADLTNIGMGIAEMPWGVYKAASSSVTLPKTQDASQKAPSVVTDTASVTTASTSSAQPSNNTSVPISNTPETALAPLRTIASAETPTPESSLRTESITPQGRPRSASGPQNLGQPRIATSSTAYEPPFNVENIAQAGRGVGRIVETGLKSPMNFCMGLARGFRNLPRLYNDDTVRPLPKVTGMQSGLKVAGKEFGLGFYDGIAGLVQQPIKGAKNDGARGLVTGIGKGLGGFMVKPAAGLWALPAYTMAGIHAEYRSKSVKSMHNYIVASRIRQGDDDYQASDPDERSSVIELWHTTSRKDDLQPFYLFKGKEIALKARAREAGELGPKNSWLQKSKTSLGVVIDQQRIQWLQIHGGSADALRSNSFSSASTYSLAPSMASDSTVSGVSPASISEDEQFERAIQASVRETSRGDSQEDLMIEEAIRASIAEMRRSRSGYNDSQQASDAPPQVEGVAFLTDEAITMNRCIQRMADIEGGVPAAHGMESNKDIPTAEEMLAAEDMQITDEEYQRLIAEAVQNSTMEQQDIDYIDEFRRIPEDLSTEATHQAEGVGNRKGKGKGRQVEGTDYDEDAEFQRALIESRMQDEAGPSGVGVEGDEGEQLRRAIEESQAEAAGPSGVVAEGDEGDQLRRAIEESEAEAAGLREEEIILEYVRKQSIAEESYRQRLLKGKMRETASSNEDEELLRVLAESLKTTKLDGDGDGPSH